MANIAFIIHGKLQAERIRADVEAVFGSDHLLSFFVSQHEGHFVELAEAAVKSGSTHVICIGGDGSLNEVANGLMRAKEGGISEADWQKVRIGLLPHGTGNDFARTAVVKYDLAGLKNLIETDSYRAFDLGRAEYSSSTQDPVRRYFINITDVGLGGAIALDLSTAGRFWGPTITYQKAIVVGFFKYKKQGVRVKCNTFNYEGKILNLIVANGAFFGGGMGIAPGAKPDDGQFLIVLLADISLWDYVKNMGKIKRAEKIEHPQLKYYQGNEITIEPTGTPLAIDMDGEFVGYAPLHISLIPKALRFICPR